MKERRLVREAVLKERTAPFVPVPSGGRMRLANAVGTASVAVMVLLLAPVRPLLAQYVGDRVRVTTPEQTLVGAVAAVSESGLTLRVPGGWHLEVARGRVEHLEVSEIRRSTWMGLGIGIGAGLVGSLVRKAWRPKPIYCGNQPSVGAAISCNLKRARLPPPPSDSEIFATTTIAGAVLGALAGTLVRRDVWKNVAPGSAGAFALAPVLDTRLGHDGGSAVILGTRITF